MGQSGDHLTERDQSLPAVQLLLQFMGLSHIGEQDDPALPFAEISHRETHTAPILQTELLSAGDEDVIGQLSPSTTDEPFAEQIERDRIHTRYAIGCVDDDHTSRQSFQQAL